MLNKLVKFLNYIIHYIIHDKFLLILIVLLFLLVIINPNFIEYFPSYVDWNAYCLIIFYIILSRAFILSGLIDNIALKTIDISNNLYELCSLIVFMTIIMSFLATNDGAVLIMVPLAISVSKLLQGNREKLVTFVLLAANTGSFLLPFSNPQNIIIWQHYNLSIYEIFKITIPLVSLLVLTLLFTEHIMMRGRGSSIFIYKLKPIHIPRIKVRKVLAYSSIVLLIIGVLLGEYKYGVLALILEIIVLAIIDWRVFKGVSYSLILTFLLMFPVFKELSILITIPNYPLNGPILYMFSILMSQVISNVPTTIALINYTTDWKTLLISVNIAGYISPISSLANIICFKISKISFSSYIKYSYIFIIVALIIGYILSLLN